MAWPKAFRKLYREYCLRHGLQEVDQVQRGRWEKIFSQRIDCVYKHETEYGFRAQLNTPLGGASLGCPI